MSLLPKERVQYGAIIDHILANCDMATITAKAIRKGLAARLEIDLSDKKEALQALIHERFDQAQAEADGDTTTPIPTIERSSPTNGFHNSTKKRAVKSETSATPSAVQSTPSSISPPSETQSDDDAPPKKKARKSNTKKELNDAKLAAMLQAQENSRGRSTRGGGIKKQKPLKKRTPKKKSEKKIKADDDSELEVGSDGEIKERPKKGGFHKQYHLSAPLAQLVGEPTLSRPQVVKKLWQHIKANDLQDPADMRQIRCDEPMQLVFKQERVHMFTMNKLLGNQLYDIEE